MSKKIQIVGLDIPQADWNQTDETQLDFIKNKPGLADLSDDAEHRTVTDSEKSFWNAKLDTAGGTVSGNLTVTGDLTVNGTTITEDHETIIVEDNMIVLNSNKEDLQTAFSGLSINKDSSSTYGAVYDPADDTFKFGEGTLDENNEFAFNDGEGFPLAIRSDSSELTDGHIVEWSADGNKLIDSGKSIEDVTYASGVGITLQDNQFDLDPAGDSLGGVKTGGNVTISNGVITVNDNGHNHTTENVDGLQDVIAEAISDKVGVATPTTDSETAYTKTVPANVLPNAAVCEVGGMSYRSENLLPKAKETVTLSGVTLTVNDNGSFTLNGTATANCYFVINSAELAAGTYTLSGGFRGGSWQKYVFYCNNDANWVSYGGGATYEWKGGKADFSFVVYSGVTLSNFTVYPMLNKGKTTLPYQPYFTGLRDSKVTAVESMGVNICPPLIKGIRINPSSGIAQVDETSSATDFIAIDLVNNTYRISGLSAYLFSFIVFYDDSKTFIERTSAGENTGYLVGKDGTVYIDSPERAKYMRVTTYETTVSSGSIDLVDNMQLMGSKGTNSLPYTPYTRHIFPIPEAVQNLDGYGQGVNAQYYNKIVLDPAEGVKKYVKMVGKDTFNGTESGISYVSSTGLFRVVLSADAIKDTSGVCNLYGVYVGNYTSCPDKHIMIAPTSITSDKNVIFVKDGRFSTAVEFKAFLSSNSLQVAYELATPVETDVSHLFTDDNRLPVEAGGTITAVNEFEQAVPFTIEHYTSDTADKIIGGKKIVGDLIGTATSASTLTQTLSIPKGGTGASDAENARKNLGAAPAGYGLGSNNATIVNDANNAVQIGFYRFGAENAVNYPSAFYAFRYGLFIVNRANDTVQQIATYENLLAVRYGYVKSNTWGEWEYINPPMELGVEYRTTERWNGKAVYVKLIDCGALPSNGQTSISIGVNAKNVIRIELSAIGTDMGNTYWETFSDIGGMSYEGQVFAFDSQLVIKTTEDLSGFTARAKIFYTKE